MVDLCFCLSGSLNLHTHPYQHSQSHIHIFLCMLGMLARVCVCIIPILFVFFTPFRPPTHGHVRANSCLVLSISIGKIRRVNDPLILTITSRENSSGMSPPARIRASNQPVSGSQSNACLMTG